ncbi:neonatal submandibular gland protein C, isoform CRA_c [Rattus norvegicus]|uniref:Neonatal submandibular gland protein C, isoform CRA_c n=2 Tax=Rattus norvegicus TaxID=10116 RepID=A6K7R6_RAT|nr:neonatal submandibular gland protein C, isoform CRA_c [Rattus norvegicus]
MLRWPINTRARVSTMDLVLRHAVSTLRSQIVTMKLILLYLAVVLCTVCKGDSNKVSGPSSSAVVSTDSGDDGNLEDKQVPRFNGDERDGENNSDFFGAGSLDTGNTSDSGSHNLSSGSGSSVRSNVSIGAGPSDQNESADLGGSGRVTCAGKTVSGASSVA